VVFDRRGEPARRRAWRRARGGQADPRREPRELLGSPVRRRRAALAPCHAVHAGARPGGGILLCARPRPRGRPPPLGTCRAPQAMPSRRRALPGGAQDGRAACAVRRAGQLLPCARPARRRCGQHGRHGQLQGRRRDCPRKPRDRAAGTARRAGRGAGMAAAAGRAMPTSGVPGGSGGTARALRQHEWGGPARTAASLPATAIYSHTCRRADARGIQKFIREYIRDIRISTMSLEEVAELQREADEANTIVIPGDNGEPEIRMMSLYTTLGTKDSDFGDREDMWGPGLEDGSGEGARPGGKGDRNG